MARTRSLTDMISDVRQRADVENSQFVTDLEITEMLNQELAELHGRLVLCEGQPHFRSSVTINVVAGTALYPLPGDFFAVQEVTATYGGLNRTLEPFMANERAMMTNSQPYPPFMAPQYRIQSGNIEVLPTMWTFPLSLYYIATSVRLVSGGDTVDGFDGYEVAAIHGATAMCLQKEESDASTWLALKDRIYKQIDALAAARDRSHPERASDVVGLSDGVFPYFPYGF